MKNLKFKYAAAYNFLPFGSEGIEIHFDNYKNIVLVRGENRDAKQTDNSSQSDELRVSSNGTGKSSIQEIITYGLFGKTVKRPEKLNASDVVHNKIGKDAKVELIFDDVRIIRTRKENGKDAKNSLRLWESKEHKWDKDTEITQGTMALTQKKIEEMIGLSYEAFINMSVFTDDQRACFLECESKQKKEIVENMLSLGVYREWFENAKNLRKEIKSKIDIKAKEYNLLSNSKDDAVRRLNLTIEKEKKWIEEKNKEIETLTKSLEELQKNLGKTNNGAALLAYQEAQNKIKQIHEEMPKKEAVKNDLNSKLNIAKEKENSIKEEANKLSEKSLEITRAAKNLLLDRTNKESEIKKMQDHEIGAKCDKCKGEILEDNINQYIEKINDDIREINIDLKKQVDLGKNISVEVEKVKEKQNKIKEIISKLNSQILDVEKSIKSLQSDLVKASQVREPKTDNEESLLQQKIETINSQLKEKNDALNGDSPYKDIIENDKNELEKSKKLADEKQSEVKTLEAEIPYYDYWVTGFGDSGIRKWVVDGIIPELNNRINYWLQFLIDNKITLKFDNELNETIERNPSIGDPYIYHAMSTGQRRRLNLAVSQAFAHIMAISSGSVPSIVFLDEVSQNIDPVGVIGIYKMICELAEDRQVFVTTHDPDLLRMLQTTDALNLVMENGFTKLVV